MRKKKLSQLKSKDMHRRDACCAVNDYIDKQVCRQGDIVILYGLKGTGKTTVMEQIVKDSESPEKCAFYEIEDDDEMNDIYNVLEEEIYNGVNVVCFDEITNSPDFIKRSALLPDIYAKAGMTIIITGADSLAFYFAEENALFFRTTRIDTTYISFAEYCRIFGIRDIDDYIKHGGLMGKAADDVYDYESASKYLDAAVTENIVRSLEKDNKDRCLKQLSYDEIHIMVEKLIKKCCGTIDTELFQNNSDSGITRLSGAVDDIVGNLTEEMNADADILTPVSRWMVSEMIDYLSELNVVSVTPKLTAIYEEDKSWLSCNGKDYHVIQPALKYYFLQKKKEFIEQDSLRQRLDKKIKDDMVEQITIFDTEHNLSGKRYKLVKPTFYINGEKKGEYGMVIWDADENAHWSFEIKYDSVAGRELEAHLQDEVLRKYEDWYWGARKDACVLYRGESFKSSTGIYYLNITDFALAMEKYKDAGNAMESLTQGLLLTPI